MAKPRVVIIEDAWWVHLRVWEHFGDRIEVLSACCRDDAISILRENAGRLDVIVIDARFAESRDRPDNESEENGFAVLRVVVELGFECPKVSISQSEELRAQFLEAGCTHACNRKFDLPTTLTSLLQLAV